ncbi:MAG: hypothetical protein VX346_04410 [Planctomycetota bacterium]|nr:hypothetical protein [Planctomycetota bacterium]
MRFSPLEKRIAIVGMMARIIVYLVMLFLAGGDANAISGDSADLHYKAYVASFDYRDGQTDWGMLIDDAWPLVVGIVYYYVYPSLLVIVLLNGMASGLALVLLFRIVQMATSNRLVAVASCYTVALFPSAVFFQCLPIKEAVAMLAIIAMTWGLLRVRLDRDLGGVKWMALAVVMVVGLRVYLAPILVYCAALTLLIRGRRGVAQAVAQLTLWSVMFVLFLTIALDLGGLEWRQLRAFEYLDVNRLNTVRGSLSRGDGGLFSQAEQSSQSHEFGVSLSNDVILLLTGFYYFLVGIDFFNIRSTRQWAAVPEAVIVIGCLPYLFFGVKALWRNHRTAGLPILILTFALVTVYGAGTTNMGAMYRWRLQAMPFVAMTTYLGAAHWRRGPLFALLKSARSQLPRRRFALVFQGRAR